VLGLSLGYHRGGRPLRAEDRHALVVFGLTQSGKSAGVAIPNILEWAGPAIVVSIKPDLLDADADDDGARRPRRGAGRRPYGSSDQPTFHLAAVDLLTTSWLQCILAIAPSAASASHHSQRDAPFAARTSTRSVGKGPCPPVDG
jgi:Type IV secretory system Conjugative DNA transfer